MERQRLSQVYTSIENTGPATNKTRYNCKRRAKSNLEGTESSLYAKALLLSHTSTCFITVMILLARFTVEPSALPGTAV